MRFLPLSACREGRNKFAYVCACACALNSSVVHYNSIAFILLPIYPTSVSENANNNTTVTLQVKLREKGRFHNRNAIVGWNSWTFFLPNAVSLSFALYENQLISPRVTVLYRVSFYSIVTLIDVSAAALKILNYKQRTLFALSPRGIAEDGNIYLCPSARERIAHELGWN